MGDNLLPRSGGGCLEVGLPAPTLLPLGPGSVTLIEGREMKGKRLRFLEELCRFTQVHKREDISVLRSKKTF